MCIILNSDSDGCFVQGMIQTDQAVQLLSQFVQSMTSAKVGCLMIGRLLMMRIHSINS